MTLKSDMVFQVKTWSFGKTLPNYTLPAKKKILRATKGLDAAMATNANNMWMRIDGSFKAFFSLLIFPMHNSSFFSPVCILHNNMLSCYWLSHRNPWTLSGEEKTQSLNTKVSRYPGQYYYVHVILWMYLILPKMVWMFWIKSGVQRIPRICPCLKDVWGV